MKELTAKNVEQIFEECFYAGRIKQAHKEKGVIIVVQGALAKIAFRSDKINANRQEIQEMLYQLPAPFLEEKGGQGWSFLNACNNYRGEQWTGLHSIMDMLFCLGTAIGKVKCLLAPALWKALSGGMPYYQVTK